MDDLCSRLSNTKISEELLINIDTWQQNLMSSHGIYKELITSQTVYRMYSYGVFEWKGNGLTKRTQIKLVERDGDIFLEKTY